MAPMIPASSRVATFNVQNLRLRRRDGALHLDGARDRDAPGETGPAAEALDDADRALTARVIAAAAADVLALQEVFDQATLDHLNERWLRPLGADYPHRCCLEGNDGRSQDVAILSRLPFDEVHSHAALRFADVGAAPPPGVDPDRRVFRRDCLAVRVGARWLFVCHLKAALPGDEISRAVRRAEATAVRHVIETRVRDPRADDWLALGDFNTHRPDCEEDLRPLTGLAVDLTARLPEAERWTYHMAAPDLYSCPDRIYASPALAARHPNAVPRVLRLGVSREAARDRGPRLEGVGLHRPRASDHALLQIDLPS